MAGTTRRMRRRRRSKIRNPNKIKTNIKTGRRGKTRKMRKMRKNNKIKKQRSVLSAFFIIAPSIIANKIATTHFNISHTKVIIAALELVKEID